MQHISLYPVVSLKKLCLSRVGKNLCMKYWSGKRKGIWEKNSSLPAFVKYFVDPLIRLVQIWSFPKSPRSGVMEPLLNIGCVTELELYFDLSMEKTWKFLEALEKYGKLFTSIKFYNIETELRGFCRTTLEMVPSKIKRDLHFLFLACENLEKLDIHVPFDVKVLHGNLKLEILTLRFELSNIRDLIPEEGRSTGALHTLFAQDTSFKNGDLIMLLKAYPELKQVSSIRTKEEHFYPFSFLATRNKLNPLELTWIEVGELSFELLEFAEKSCPNLKFLNFELKIRSMSQSLQDKLALTGYSLGVLCNRFERIHADMLGFFEKLGNQIKRLHFNGWTCELDVQKLDVLCPNLEFLSVVVLNLRLFVGYVRRSSGSRNSYSKLKELLIVSNLQYVLEEIEKSSLSYVLNNCKELEKLHLERTCRTIEVLLYLNGAFFLSDDILQEVLCSNNLHNLKSCFLVASSLSLYGLRSLLTSAKSLEKLNFSTIENTSFENIQHCVDCINPSIVNLNGVPDHF